MKTLPAVREAIEQKDWKLAQQSIEKTGAVIEQVAMTIESAVKEMETR